MSCESCSNLNSSEEVTPLPTVSVATFLANVNSFTIAVARLSVVCLSVTLVHPILRRLKFSATFFRQYFYGIWYLGHPLTSAKIFTEIVPGEPLRHAEPCLKGRRGGCRESKNFRNNCFAQSNSIVLSLMHSCRQQFTGN